MMQRFLISAGVLFAIIFLPYWVYLPVLFLAMLFQPFYWEAIVWVYIIEALYGTGGDTLPKLVLLVVVSLIVLLPLRERVRFNL